MHQVPGNWNFVNPSSNASGTITFGAEVLPIKTSASNEVAYGFSGIINDQPVSGWYSYSLGGYDFLSLYYTYHHRAVQVMGVLNIINPAHMEMTNVYSFHQHGGRDDNLATGFHLHYGDIIHLVRGGTALNIPSSQLEHQAHTAYDNGPAIAHVTNESWRYDEGFLQGVSGVVLKGTHTGIHVWIHQWNQLPIR